MKKLFISFIAILVLSAAVCSLTACYVSKPDTMESLTGTYALTRFARRDINAAESDENTDMIKEKGITMFLVINENGTGYMVYKDNDTPLFARAITISFEYEGEDSALVKSLKYYDGVSSTKGDGYPGKGEETLGLTFGKTSKRLTYDIPGSATFKRYYSQYVEYTKVSDASDLSYASQQTGTTLSACMFELNGLKTVSKYYGVSEETEPYIYYIYDIDAINKKADLYYALKENEEPVVQRNLPITVARSTDEYGIVIVDVTIGDIAYKRRISGLEYPITTLFQQKQAEDDQIYDYYMNSESRDVQTCIDEAVSQYHTYLQEKEQEQQQEQQQVEEN